MPLNTLLPCAVTSGLIPIITHAKIWRKPTAATVVVASVAKPAERSKFKHIITLNTDPFCAMPLLNRVCISTGLPFDLFAHILSFTLQIRKVCGVQGSREQIGALSCCMTAFIGPINLSLGLAMRSHRENASTPNGRAIKHATMETTIARATGMVAIVVARTTTTNIAKLVNVLTHM